MRAGSSARVVATVAVEAIGSGVRAGAASGRRALAIIDVSSYHCIMRTTLTLDDDVCEAARALALASGRRLGQVVSELVRRSLRAPPAIAVSNGLPVFNVRDGAPIIPSDRARDLLADEL
jgi:hypothetical protein